MSDTKENTVNNDKGNEAVKKRRLTAFDLASMYLDCTSLRKIDGVLHAYHAGLRYFCPVEKADIEKDLFYRFFELVKETGSLKIVKDCADIIIRMNHLSALSAEKQMLFCMQNGYIDLKDLEKTRFIDYKELKEMPIATYSIAVQGNVYMTDWGYAKSLPTPWMDYFIACITQGNQIIADRIWQIIGYLLTPDMNAKAWFLLQGVPNSGKSVIGNLLKSLFPDAKVESLDIDQLGKRTATSMLVNKCVNISMDLPNKSLSPLAIRNIKLMTGNDDITVEYGNGKYQRYHGNCKFVFATNHALTLKGCDSGFEERIVCIPFTKSVEQTQRNINLLYNLQSEKDAIVAKALAYYRDLRYANYKFAGSDLDACKPNIRYLPIEAEDTDAQLCEFVDTQCRIVPVTVGRTYTDKLYNAYKVFCRKNNYTPIGDSRAFSRRLHKCYAEYLQKEKWRDGTENQNGFLGIVLNVEE